MYLVVHIFILESFLKLRRSALRFLVDFISDETKFQSKGSFFGLFSSKVG